MGDITALKKLSMDEMKHMNLQTFQLGTTHPTLMQIFGILPNEFAQFKIAMALTKLNFKEWTEVHYFILRVVLREEVHLQTSMSHKLHVVCVGMILWGNEAFGNPQMFARLFQHDNAKLSLLERIAYSFMHCVQEAKRLSEKSPTANINGISQVAEMEHWVQLKGMHHHYTFCDHHFQHWKYGRGSHSVKTIPLVVLKEMITDGLACSMERGGPFTSYEEWIKTYRTDGFPPEVQETVKSVIDSLISKPYPVEYIQAKESIVNLLAFISASNLPSWDISLAGISTLDTYQDCESDVHVARHNSMHDTSCDLCDCDCCHKAGCHVCKTSAELGKVDLRTYGYDDDDLESLCDQLQCNVPVKGQPTGPRLRADGPSASSSSRRPGAGAAADAEEDDDEEQHAIQTRPVPRGGRGGRGRGRGGGRRRPQME